MSKATFSQCEQQVLEALKTAKHDSLWNVAINQVIDSNDPVRLRELIVQLQSQNMDNPGVMRTMLGDAYETVINFKPIL